MDGTKDIARTPNASNGGSSDPSPYSYMPSSPLISVASVPLPSLPSSSSSPSSPSRPTLLDNQQEAETIQTNSGSSSPSSRKRKALPSGMNENRRSISSEEEGSKDDHVGSPVKRNCTKSLSSNSSSSRSTTPVEVKVHDPPSAPASPWADLPPLLSSSSSTGSLSWSSTSPGAESVSPSQQPPAPLPPQPAPPPTGQRRSSGRLVKKTLSA
jgi:hypothetical protein